jgi:D-lactate dehydrogenase (cytochrome)
MADNKNTFSNKLILSDVLERDVYERIDKFCAELADKNSLSELSLFLENTFGVKLELDEDIVNGYISDSSNLPGNAVAVARPASERDYALISRVCFSACIPFTVSAGRSNLTGSATPVSGIIISLENMTAPEVTVDEESMMVRTPVGIILEELRKEVLRQSNGRLVFPVDPTSRNDAMVGGAIACNASGFTPGDIGAMRHWVESIDFVLPNGLKIQAKRGQYLSIDGKFIFSHDRNETVMNIPRYQRPAIKNASGPYSSPDGIMDFIDLVVGSEGILGIVTACCLKLQKVPEEHLDLFFSLPEEKNALKLYQYLYKRFSGDFSSLSALEYFGVNCRNYMDHEQKLFMGNNQVGVFIQVPVYKKSLDDVSQQWFEILIDAGCGIDENAIKIMLNDRDRALFLEARHSMPSNSLEVVQRRGTYTIMTDTVVPEKRFEEFLEFTHNLLRDESLDYLTFGHLGDCHLHFMVLPEKNQLIRATQVYEMIIEKSACLGGVYSGEHGTGKRKVGDFLKCYGKDAADQVRLSKSAVDPHFLLNRGNVIVYQE